MKYKVLAFVGLMILFASLSINSEAAVPHLLRYQGTLTDANNVPLNGSYNLTFRIYDAATAGTLLWSETRTSETQTAVSVSDGVFSVLLGSVTALNLAFDADYWLSTEVGTSGEMSPRQRITSVGYAIRAEIADTIKDPTLLVPKGAIIMWSGLISNIPAGWALCDGTNGTPDLRDKFIYGVSAGENPGATGGNNFYSLTIEQLPPHTHSLRHGITGSYRDLQTSIDRLIDTSIGDFLTGSTGSGAPIDNRPAYFKLAFIMKL